MANYYVNQNPQSTGEHEVHRGDCTHLPTNRTYLGDHATCEPAVRAAAKIYPNVDGCRWCSPACHKR